MVKNQNIYNQQQMMPPRPLMPMRQRVINGAAMVKDAFPKWVSQYSIVVYILALMVVTFMYSIYSLPWYYMLSGVVSVLVFFLYGSTLVKNNALDKVRRESRFEKKLFIIAFIPRLSITLLLYWLFQAYYGDAFGFENADATQYDLMASYVADMIAVGDFHFYDRLAAWSGYADLSDMGFAIYAGFVYYLTGKSIIALRLLKCVWSSLTVLLMYRLAKRSFDIRTARIVAIMVALWPNFWYYCSSHLKETEMVFLAVFFVEQADQMLRTRQFSAWKVIPVLLVGAAMFTFRTVLGLVAILALVFTIVMSSTKVVSWGKRIMVGGLALVLIAVTMGNRLEERAGSLMRQVQSGDQERNMEWRANRKDEGGNQQKFAKYAGAAVFAPMIFTLPFPTMLRPYEAQDMQQLLNGGNYIKNVMSFFTIFAMFTLLFTGKWRDYMLPLSFMVGYLVVLAFSAFAQSERFHQPVMPFEFMFAAYGLSIAVTQKKYKRWFMYWCIVMFIAAVAWNWFKLAGRGLV